MNISITFIVIMLILLFVGGIWISVYNKLIRRRNWVTEAFSQIDVQLQRRNDLIPNLVNTVKGYASHESETLEAVTSARQQLINISSDADPTEINAISNELTSALSRLIAVAEQYPDLKANTNFLQLQTTLEELEKQIAIARQLYNSSVTEYNNDREQFPNSIVASVHNFEREAVLEAPAEARQVPTVEF
ncbi:LemA family protein [Aerococcaceae bacterium DSM 111022]|nr:LemA family protein [Aerococcaceae bacterium DSM 111022]